ncbi:MAG TPA: serine/threonine-protein kinase, partial [Myxococcaceae bacterium]|nr:serine/threonine-protein kinase [Myxococcaceae bacterium]
WSNNAAPYEPKPTDDVFALGIILYQVLTGQRPFASRQLVIQTPPAHPSDVTTTAPRPLGDLALRLLAIDPTERIGDGQRLQQELRAAMAEAAPYLFASAPKPITDGTGAAPAPAHSPKDTTRAERGDNPEPRDEPLPYALPRPEELAAGVPISGTEPDAPLPVAPVSVRISLAAGFRSFISAGRHAAKSPARAHRWKALLVFVLIAIATAVGIIGHMKLDRSKAAWSTVVCALAAGQLSCATIVRNGEVEAVMNPRADVPDKLQGARLHGTAHLHRDRVSFQFSSVTLASGERLPICVAGSDERNTIENCPDPACQSWVRKAGPDGAFISGPGVNLTELQ